MKKILKKYLTKREKSGKIGKLSERAVTIQRLKLCQNPEKNFEKSLKKVLTKEKASDIIAKHVGKRARNRTLETRFDAR